MVATTQPQTWGVSDQVLRAVAQEVQIPEDRAAEAERLYMSLGQHLDSGNLKQHHPEIFPQGSFSYQATVKPIAREEFDIDTIALMQYWNGTPESLIEGTVACLDTFPGLPAKPEVLDRCVRVKVPGRFHIDVVPARPSKYGGDLVEIPDKVGDQWQWKLVNPKGFREWFESRCLTVDTAVLSKRVEPLPDAEPITTKPDLKVALQLVKRNQHLFLDGRAAKLRTPSIVLTTLAGHVGSTGVVEETLDALIRTLSGVAELGQAPDLRNPVNDEEVITEKWADPEVFEAFCEWVRTLAVQWQQYKGSKGAGIQSMTQSLEAMFGAQVTRRAVARMGDRLDSASRASSLQTTPSTLLAVGGIKTGARPKKFYGAGVTNGFASQN